MKQSAIILGVVILAGATVLGGFVHGRMSRRWGAVAGLERLAARMQEFPAEIGPWKMSAEQPLSSAAAATLECAGYVGRRYENSKTGEAVTMALLLGPAGPISVHTPDVCYGSSNYVIRQTPTPVKMPRTDEGEDELWQTTVQSTDLDANYLRVYHAWSTGGAWQAPQDARFAYVGKPYLYKIQVTGAIPSLDAKPEADMARNFLKESLPVVQSYLLDRVKD